MLIMMSNRINKQKKTSSKQSLIYKIYLLRSFSLNPSKMPSYNYYIRLRFSTYEIFPLDSLRCIEYIRKNRSDYNILGVSFKQFLVISAQHFHIETELEKVEERIVRFRK